MIKHNTLPVSTNVENPKEPAMKEFTLYKRILANEQHLEFQSENGAVNINLCPDGTIAVHCFSLDRMVTKYNIREHSVSGECYIAGRQKLAFEGEGWEPEKPMKPRFTLLQLATEYFKKSGH